MLADDLSVNRLRREPERAADHLTQPRRIEHGARADDALERQSRAHGDFMGQDVDRVRYDEEDAGIPAKVPRDFAYQPHVVSRQIETRFAGPPTPPGRDDDGIGRPHLVEGHRPDGGDRIEGCPVRQVHRFAFRNRRPCVVEQQLLRDTGMER